MSESNGKGVIRITRKGRKSFCFGEEGTPGSKPFVVDVVDVFHRWLATYDSFRQEEEDEDGERPIPPENRDAYHEAAIKFVEDLRKTSMTPGDDGSAGGYEQVSVGEALDFFARLREEYDALLVFMRPKLREERDSPASSEEGSVELRYSVEGQGEKAAS